MKSKIISILVIVVTFFVAIIRVTDNSEKIILHWDFCGNITSYGEKYLILIIPIISVLLYGLFLHYEKNPYKMSGISKISVTESNTMALVTYIRVIALLVLLLSLYVTTCAAQYLTLYPLLVTVVLLFIIAFYIYTRKKIRANNR